VSDKSNNQDAINCVSTGGATGKNNPIGQKGLPDILRWFKGRTTFEINKKYPVLNFKWQPSFYDRVIRDEEELNNIRQYIDYNPDKWQWDRNNPRNISK
jgi:putative transposase